MLGWDPREGAGTPGGGAETPREMLRPSADAVGKGETVVGGF